MSGTNDITQLRKHLFDTIDGIKNKTISMEQAKAITEVSQVIVNTAKVEVEYARATGGEPGSGFLQLGGNTSTTHPAPGRTVHRIK